MSLSLFCTDTAVALDSREQGKATSGGVVYKCFGWITPSSHKIHVSDHPSIQVGELMI